MKATIPYIRSKFEQYNRLCFGGTLPMIPIELSDAKTFVGVCVYRVKRVAGGKRVKYDFRLRINTRIDLPEAEVEDTIIHEMIHYYIGYNQLKDTSAHGQLFRSIMDSINAKYGRHVTISHKSTEKQREQAIDSKPRWHVIAVVSLADGKYGIKVLPRIVQRILTYYNVVSTAKDVTNISLYMSRDVYFNRYPTSSVFKIHPVDKSVIDQHLNDATRLTCDGSQVIINNN